MKKTKNIFLIIIVALLLTVPKNVSAITVTSWADASVNYIFNNHDVTIPRPGSLTVSYKTYPVNTYTSGNWLITQNFKSAAGPLTTVSYEDVDIVMSWSGIVSWSKFMVTETSFTYESIIPEPEPEPEPEPVEEWVVLKSNFHAHSTVSDGQLTPQQVVQMYYNHGYDVLAITDHGSYRQYDMALSTAQGLGITLIPGSEIIVHDTSSVSASEVLGLFITGPVSLTKDGDISKVTNQIHEMGGIAIVCHPTKTASFWETRTTTTLVDGWECPEYFPDLGYEDDYVFLRNHDFHNARQEYYLDNWYNLVISKSNSMEDIKEALLNNRVVYYENGVYHGSQENLELLNSIT